MCRKAPKLSVDLNELQLEMQENTFNWHLGILAQAVAHNGSLYATVPDSPSPFGLGVWYRDYGEDVVPLN